MDDHLLAIANPRRRAMLELAASGERSASELATHAGLSRPAASQHLNVLLDAGLVDVRTNGRHRLYRVRPETLAELRRQLDDFWEDSLGVELRT